jgi:hypothetical protein
LYSGYIHLLHRGVTLRCLFTLSLRDPACICAGGNWPRGRLYGLAFSPESLLPPRGPEILRRVTAPKRQRYSPSKMSLSTPQGSVPQWTTYFDGSISRMANCAMSRSKASPASSKWRGLVSSMLKRADAAAVAKDQRMAGIEANPGRTGNVGVVGKSFIQKSIADNQGLALEYGVAAE